MIRILVVDDSALVRKLLGQIFSTQDDFQVAFARNAREALNSIAAAVPDVVTLDVHMPDMDGLQCLDRIMIEHPCPVIMVSSMTADGADATLEALRLGAIDFVAKPTGAVSLKMDALAPELISKVRQAAGAKLRSSLRLRERIRHKSAASRSALPRKATSGDLQAAAGEGLVLVGASTGGPPALEALLVPLPSSFPWPIVVAQHMPATFTGSLARRLDRLCGLTVTEVVAASALEPGHVYIGRGDADIIVSKRKGALMALPAPAEVGYPWHPSTDRLVRSALNHVDAGQLVGILMTGMGNDGAQAMTDLNANGGRTIAEAEETAVVWGMPGELVKAGGADFVLPLPDIAAQLRKLVP